MFTFLKRGAALRRAAAVSLGVAAASASAFAFAAPSSATDHYYCLLSFAKGAQCGYGSTLPHDVRNRAYVPSGDGNHEACASVPGGGFVCAWDNSDNYYASQSYYPFIKAPEGGTLQGLTTN